MRSILWLVPSRCARFLVFCGGHSKYWKGLEAGREVPFSNMGRHDPRVQRWQRWSEPIPHRVFEGCYVTWDIPSLITQSGFSIEQMEAAYLAPFPKSWSYSWWGTAIPQLLYRYSGKMAPPQ